MEAANPFLGVLYHWLGGLAAASFYLPYKAVRRWSWETYWLVGGLFSWLLAPVVLATALVPNLLGVLLAAPRGAVLWAYLFGVLWGVGGLTFGLSVRYLGVSLGYAIALGMCTACGTLLPPLCDHTFGKLVSEASGQIVLIGIGVCLVGIAISAVAGHCKEQETAAASERTEFSFLRGVAVATFAGVMSACMSYGLAAGKPIAALAARSLTEHHRVLLWQNLPVLVVVLAGGLTTNLLWCVTLNLRHGTGGEYLAPTAGRGDEAAPVPLAANYGWCALAGVAWYLQFFFYSMGTTKMGRYDFSSWTLHMASIIIFSTLWGLALREWRGTSGRTKSLVGLGLVFLIASTVMVGYGNYVKTHTMTMHGPH